MTDKILFIVPPNIGFQEFIKPSFNARIKEGEKKVSLVTDMPLGILDMSAYIKKYANIETKLLDFNVTLNKIDDFKFKSFKDFFYEIISLEKVNNYRPDVVGISALFAPVYKSMIDIAECCKEIFPNSFIVAGGSLPTNIPREIFKISKNIDALCYKEGEKPLLNLIQSQNKYRYVEESPSWITRKKIENNQLIQSEFIENLDEIPFSDFSILNVQDYNLNPTMKLYPSMDHTKRTMPIMTSRGCVFNCCFCASHTIHGKKMRYYTVPRIRENIRLLKEEYCTETITFLDDHFMGNKQRATEILNIVADLKMTAFFVNSLNLYALDKEMLQSLKKAGADTLVLSIESGSDRVLKEIMHKPLTTSQIKKVVNDCRQLGIYTDANILIGLPGETKKDIQDSRNFLNNIDANWYRIYAASPLVGSEMMDKCIKNGYIPQDWENILANCDFKRAVVNTEEFSAEYIQEQAYFLNMELNFVNNKDMRFGNYNIALKGFENAINAKNDHALAYYYASKCYGKLGQIKKAQEYIQKSTLFGSDPFWQKYIKLFEINDLLIK